MSKFDYRLIVLQNELTGEHIYDLHDRYSDQHNYYTEDLVYIGCIRWMEDSDNFKKFGLGNRSMWKSIDGWKNELELDKIKLQLLKSRGVCV